MFNIRNFSVKSNQQVAHVVAICISLCLCHCGGAQKPSSIREEPTKPQTDDGPIKTDPHLGMVFPSIEIFISTALANMKNDKNLRIEADPKREEFIWLRDESPDQNPWLYLFRKMSNGVVRFILFIPGAKEVSFMNESVFPDIYTADWTPGYPKPSALFKYKSNVSYYVPEKCEETYLETTDRIPNDIPLNKLEEIATKNKRGISCHEMFLNYGNVDASLRP